MANDIDFSRYISRYQVKRREEEQRQEEIENYAYDIDNLLDDYDLPDDEYEEILRMDDEIYGVEHEEPAVTDSSADIDFTEEPVDDGVFDSDEWNVAENAFSGLISEKMNSGTIRENSDGGISGSSVLEQVREQKKEDVGTETALVSGSSSEPLPDKVSQLRHMPTSDSKRSVSDVFNQTGQTLFETEVETIRVVEEEQRKEELRKEAEKKAKAKAKAAATKKKTGKTKGGKQGKNSKTLGPPVAVASLRDFPKEIYDEMAREFKSGPKQTDIVIAWILSHADESLYRNVADVLTQEQIDLFKNHKEKIERSPVEKLNQVMKRMQKQAVEIKELRLLLIYLIYGIVGFRQNQTDYQNIGSFDLNEDRMVDFVSLVEGQLKILRNNVNFDQGRPY